MKKILSLAPLLLVFINSPAAPAAARDGVELPRKVTYTRDIAPLLSAKCGSCHRPGDIAPMALRTYDEVRPWAKSIRRVVNDGTMPPWHADPAYGVFSNDRSLSSYETALINKWVKQGTALGDSTDLAEGLEAPEGWRLGEPDLEVVFEEVSVPGGGPDVFEDLIVEYELSEDRWIRSVEVLPGDRRVLHHVIIYILEEGASSPNGWLGAWAAGMEPMIFPEGTGRLLKKGSRLVADMHYHPTDETATDQTRLGLHFHDGEPDKELVNLWIQNSTFKIPAGAGNHEVRSSFTFEQDSVVHGLLPHMHYRGKDFTFTARYPDGREEILLQVSDYDFNWQTLYKLAEPLRMPKGSKINCVAHFDNSAANLANPDSTRDVTFGNESFDEMMIGFVDYTVEEGLRPMSAEDRIAQILVELGAEHPGSVFEVQLIGDEFTTSSALYLTSEGGPLWYIPVNGTLHKARIVNLSRKDDASYSGKVVAPFGTFTFEGTGGFGEPHVAGTIDIGADGILTFEGSVVE